jgi:transcriptional regulator with XRE-family HTH domain
MAPNEIRTLRLELGLTVDELAFALNITEAELLQIEAGESDLCRNPAFQEALDCFEERVFGTFVGA